MHSPITRTKHHKIEVLRVVLDEPRIYMEESLGSVMVRGEVIANFPKDTPIRGPIELLFEGVQKFEIWPGNIRTFMIYIFDKKFNEEFDRNNGG